ncbi:MAG: fatty acid desaturase [Elainellaceae cyanobacterium]
MTTTITFADHKHYTRDRNLWINGAALAYTFGGYGVAIALLLSPSWLLNGLGVLLLTHTLMWAAYFVHDCIHGTVFQKQRWNEVLGQALLFLTGSCYCRYKHLARAHLAHHKNRADFSSFSLPEFLRSLPQPVLRLIIVSEWLYLPAINFIQRWMAALAPFFGEARKDERLKNGLLLLVRGSLFTLLALTSPKALVLYFVAYVSLINILRFLDCFQHTYTVFRWDEPLPNYDLQHEEVNTFSNILSQRHPLLNLIFLNFGYHNAHHRVVRCPWYLLPQLDAELYDRDYRQTVTLPRLVGNYHRFRVTRLFEGQGAVVDAPEGSLDLNQFVGAVGVSFLVQREG